MPSGNKFKWKEMLLGVCALAMVLVVLIALALFPVRVVPIESMEAPEFVGQYINSKVGPDVIAMVDEDNPESSELLDTMIGEVDTLAIEADVPFDYVALAKGVVLNGEPGGVLIDLLSNPDPTIRIDAANAVAVAISETNYYIYANTPAEIIAKSNEALEALQRFWDNIEDDIEIVRNAFYEALVASADEEDSYNWIPNTLAEMPGQNEETIELLAWTANNHKSTMMRKTSLFNVVTLDPHSNSTTELLLQRANDPSIRVRFDALEFRITRWVN